MTPAPNPTHNEDHKEENWNTNTNLPALITNPSGSEESEDDFANSEHGYELLPQEPMNSNSQGRANSSSSSPSSNNNYDDDSSNSFPSNSVQASYYASQARMAQDESAEQTQIWSRGGSQHPAQQQPMNSEHIAQIKSAMAGFSLPSSCIPSWATAVPEETWKKELLAFIHERKSSQK